MKYKPLESPCKECIYKCGRVEQVDFVKDENCRYREKEIEWKQERIKI